MHPHSHDPGTGRAFAIGIALNLAFVLAEWTCGVLANSLSLIANRAAFATGRGLCSNSRGLNGCRPTAGMTK